MRTAAGTVVDGLTQVVEGVDDVVESDVGEPERSDTGCVHHPALGRRVRAGQGQHHRLRRGMPALADPGHHAGGPLCLRHKTIDQSGFAYPGMADERGEPAGEDGGDLVERVVAAAEHDRQVEIGEGSGEFGGIGEIGLRQAQDRCQAADVGGGQRAFHESGARWWIGQCGDDQQLVGIGHHDAFIRVGVVGGAAQHGGAVGDLDDARQRVRPTGQIADHRHLIADDDRRAAQFPCAHRGDPTVRVAVEDAAPAATVDRHDHGRAGVVVARSLFRARSAALARTYPDVGFVVARGAPTHVRGARSFSATCPESPAASYWSSPHRTP